MSAAPSDAPCLEALRRFVEAELDAPAPAPVRTVAEAARTRHGSGIVAVLFYGSCLRDGYEPGRMVDLYLLADSYRSVHPRRLARLANRLVPPNVYYVEADHEGVPVRAKYALVTLDQFERRMRPSVRNPYFWARFAQPAGLVYARDPAVQARISRALATATLTAWQASHTLVDGDAPAAVRWASVFAATYRTELRAEKPERAREIVARYGARFERIARILDDCPQPAAAPRAPRIGWRLRRIEGKLLSVLRLLKAAFTFNGGADYLAWKIERHSGVPVRLRPFHRRHPVIAAALLGFELYRRRAFR